MIGVKDTSQCYKFMINKLVHFSDLHIRLFKDHDLYKEVVSNMLTQFSEIQPDRIVFTGDLVHSKNQMTPELIDRIMLAQIPGISTITAKELMHVYGTMHQLTTQLKENPSLLDTFTYGEKKRKLSKKIVDTLKLYLIKN